eukprot:scaffold96018_cov33-Phaeocystis_antarctica.AAC.1
MPGDVREMPRSCGLRAWASDTLLPHLGSGSGSGPGGAPAAYLRAVPGRYVHRSSPTGGQGDRAAAIAPLSLRVCSRRHR